MRSLIVGASKGIGTETTRQSLMQVMMFEV